MRTEENGKRYINIGIIGGGFMGKAHTLAYDTIPVYFPESNLVPVKYFLADINMERARDSAAYLGFEKYTADWRDIVNDPAVDVVDIVVPNNLHCEIAVEALKAGKHVMCEKPMCMNTQEAKQMWDAAIASGKRTYLGYNYRKVPGVAYAQQLVAEGKIGKILNCRAEFLQDWAASPLAPRTWRFQKDKTGTGTLGDIGTHVIDACRFILGTEIEDVTAQVRTWVKERPIVEDGAVDKLGTASGDAGKLGEVDVDDEVTMLVRFKGGAIGNIECTRNAWGRKNYFYIEIHGTNGSIIFNYERLNEVQVCFADDPVDQLGFKTIYTGASHPYSIWNLSGIGIGFSDVRTVEINEYLKCIANDEEYYPNFKDGYNISLVCDGIFASDAQDKWVKTGCID